MGDTLRVMLLGGGAAAVRGSGRLEQGYESGEIYAFQLSKTMQAETVQKTYENQKPPLFQDGNKVWLRSRCTIKHSDIAFRRKHRLADIPDLSGLLAECITLQQKGSSSQMVGSSDKAA